MRFKKTIYFIGATLSIALFLLGFNNLKLYIFNRSGNASHRKKEYSTAREKYDSALKIKENPIVKDNITINSYEAKNYQEVIEEPSSKYFIQGNSFVKIGEKSTDQKEIMENFQKALESYKKAMNSSDDMNIKKNYEIIQKRLDDMKNNKNQDNKDNKNNRQDNQQNKDKPDQNSQGKDDKEKENKNNNPNDIQNDSSDNNPQKSQPQDNETTREQIERDEAMSILKKLEGNEKQSFKNNEKVLKGTGHEDSKNRW